MLSEIQAYLRSIFKDDGEKSKRNLLLASLGILILLFFISRVYLVNFTDDSLVLRFQQAKLLFINNFSPYDDDVQAYLKNEMDQSGYEPVQTAYDLELGLPQMVFYLPFAFFPDPVWGKALFLTFSAFSLIAACYMLIRLLNTDVSIFEMVGFLAIPVFGLFFLRTYFSGGLESINFLLLTSIVYLMEKQKNISAGILLGVFSFDVVNLPLAAAFVLFGLIKTKNVLSVFWSAISFGLLTLSMMIFDRNWIIGWLRNLFLTPQRVPFLTYPEALAMKYGLPIFQLFAILSLLLIIWYIFETARNPLNSKESWMWGIALTSIINYFLVLQNSDYSAVSLIIAFILIVSIWRTKISKRAWMIMIIPIGLIAAGTSAIYFLHPNVQQTPFFNIFILIASGLLVLNLYWLRRWAVRPFEYDNLITRG